MTKYIQKDKHKRIDFLQEESERKVLKSISHNLKVPNSVRLKACLSLSELPKNSSLSRIKKRCIVTGRGRFLIGQFNLSRLMLRRLAQSGFIPGLRKSSW